MVLFFRRVNWGVGPAVDDPKAGAEPPCELAAPVADPPLDPPPKPVLEFAPKPALGPLEAGTDVVGAGVDVEVEVGKRLEVVAAAVVLGVGVAEEEAGLPFRFPNILGVVEDAAGVLAGAPLNRGDAEAGADAAGLKPPNGEGADEVLDGGLLNRLPAGAGAGAVDEGWELGVLLAGVLL